jgi:hypothetical protein
MTEPNVAPALPDDAVAEPLEHAGGLPRRRREARTSSGDDDASDQDLGGIRDSLAVGLHILQAELDGFPSGDGSTESRIRFAAKRTSSGKSVRPSLTNLWASRRAVPGRRGADREKRRAA